MPGKVFKTNIFNLHSWPERQTEVLAQNTHFDYILIYRNITIISKDLVDYRLALELPIPDDLMI